MNGCHAILSDTEHKMESRDYLKMLRKLLSVAQVFRCRHLKPSHLVLLVHLDPALEEKLNSFLVLASYCIVKGSPIMLRQTTQSVYYPFNKGFSKTPVTISLWVRVMLLSTVRCNEMQGEIVFFDPPHSLHLGSTLFQESSWSPHHSSLLLP